LEVRVHPARRSGHQGTRPRGQDDKARRQLRMGFSSRAHPLGLWRPVRLELRDRPTLAATQWRSRLSDDLRTVRFSVTPAPGTGECSADVTDSSGTLVWSGARGRNAGGTLENPRLWWPQGQGAQEFYVLVFRSADGQEWRRRVGFRRVRLEMAPGQWDDHSEFPKSRSRPPVTLVVNGRATFAKGANVAPFDIFPGAITDERLVETVRLAAECQHEICGSGGGGPALPDAFYDACDSAGIMVLQEFPLACNAYPDDPDYLRTWNSKPAACWDRIAPHPCLAVWSGRQRVAQRLERDDRPKPCAPPAERIDVRCRSRTPSFRRFLSKARTRILPVSKPRDGRSVFRSRRTRERPGSPSWHSRTAGVEVIAG